MKIIKYTIKLSVIILLFLLLNNMEVFASKGTVSTDTLKLRKDASTDSTVLELLSLNDEVEILDESGNWYKVTYNQMTGYVSKDYVTAQSTQTEPEETNESNTTEPENSVNNEEIDSEGIEVSVINMEMFVSEKTNFYVLPLINSDVIGQLDKDSKVVVISIAGEWAYVKNGESYVWIVSSKLTMEKGIAVNSEKTVDTNPENINKTAYIKSTSVNLRSESNTDSKILATMQQNSEVVIIGEENDWYKIKYDNKTGYVLKSFVSDSKVETTSRSTDVDRTNSEINENVEQVILAQEKTSSSNGITGSDVVEYAKTFLGYPYKYGTAGPNSFDCSGFTSYVYSHFGYAISRSSKAQVNEGVEVAKENLQPGDILIFLNTSKTAIGHVGIYIGDDQFIHASSSTTGVIISNLSKGSYPARYVTARRILK